MDLRFTPEEQKFREEVRAFIDANLPKEVRQRLIDGHIPTKEQTVAWQQKLNARGWATPDWAQEWGGPGWTAAQRYIFREELQQAPAPSPLSFNTQMVGPVVIAFGTEEQKKHYLPRMANLDDWWCQGFSEPGAGSDLASLKTTAVRDGDFYIVNGQKTWTTLAQHANWIFCLVRTDTKAKKQEGISFLLIDMSTPGVTVRPIITIEGGHEVNEVFFDDVKVPVANLVGQENKGWDCAKFLLGNERTAQARVGASKERLRNLKKIAAEPIDGGRPLLDDTRFRDKLTEVEVKLKALEITTMRVLADEGKHHGQGKPHPASSILKIRGTQIQQMISALYVEAAGPYGLPMCVPDADGWNEPEIAPDWAVMSAPIYFNWRKQTIYGGSSEVQRQIMAKAFLGL